MIKRAVSHFFGGDSSFYIIVGSCENMKLFESVFDKIKQVFGAVASFCKKSWEKIEKTPFVLFVKKHSGIIKKVAWFLVAFSVVYIFSIVRRPDIFYGDSYDFWEYGRMFAGKPVDFAGYNIGSRGYLLSFVYYIIQSAASLIRFNEVELLYIVNSVFLGAMIAIVVPSVFSRLLKVKECFLAMLSFLAIFLFFWGGDTVYPLTDIPSAFMAIWAFDIFFKIRKEKLNIFYSLLLGGLLAGIYYIRQNYIIFSIVLFLMIVIKIFADRTKLLKAAAKVLFIIIGAGLIIAPQAYINKVNFKELTPRVKTEMWAIQTDNKEIPLFVYNARFITVMKKVDFYVVDKTGPRNQIWATNYKNTPPPNGFYSYDYIDSYEKYFKLVKKNPEYFLKSFVDAAFLGMSVTYDTAYVMDLTNLFFEHLLINYMLLSAFLVLLIKKLVKYIISKGRWKKLKSNFYNIVLITGLILSAGMSVMTKMECRYLLIYYLGIYGILSFYFFRGFEFKLLYFKNLFKRFFNHYGIVLVITTVLFFIYFNKYLVTNDIVYDAILKAFKIR